MASPLRPPTRPAASTGTPSSRRARATFIPFPPASATPSGERWRCPIARLGTTSVRATAALRVTVRIMSCLPFPRGAATETLAHCISYLRGPHPRKRRLQGLQCPPCRPAPPRRAAGRPREAFDRHRLPRPRGGPGLPLYGRRDDRHRHPHPGPARPEPGPGGAALRGGPRGRGLVRALRGRRLRAHVLELLLVALPDEQGLRGGTPR